MWMRRKSEHQQLRRSEEGQARDRHRRLRLDHGELDHPRGAGEVREHPDQGRARLSRHRRRGAGGRARRGRRRAVPARQHPARHAGVGGRGAGLAVVRGRAERADPRGARQQRAGEGAAGAVERAAAARPAGDRAARRARRSDADAARSLSEDGRDQGIPGRGDQARLRRRPAEHRRGDRRLCRQHADASFRPRRSRNIAPTWSDVSSPRSRRRGSDRTPAGRRCPPSRETAARSSRSRSRASLSPTRIE